MKSLIAALVIMFTTANTAQANDLQRLLGIVIGAAIIIEATKTPTGNTVIMPEHNRHNNPRQPGYARGLDDPSRVCYIQPHYYRTYIETIHTNCYGEILRVERTAR
jgi:hypothetical protein